MTSSPDWRGDGALPDHIVVPDDARDLEFDRLALLRERAAAKRKARWSRFLLTRRWQSHGISGPLVGLCLFVVFLFAALLALVVPGGSNSRPVALPLAKSTQPAGTVGSLLPSATLTGAGVDGKTVNSRSLRPGVVLVVPSSCSSTPAALTTCQATAAYVITTASAYGFRTSLIGAADNKDLLALATAPESKSDNSVYAVPYRDDEGVMLKTFPAADLPTAILVNAHGIVRTVLPKVTAKTPINTVLDLLSADD